MAYNDYGAFVYLNGQRQPDYEDVPIFGDKDTDLAPGMRIYASLVRQYGNMSEDVATPFQWPSRCHHGTMGNGKVRVGLYKTGIYAASIYVLKDDVTLSDDMTLYQSDGQDDATGSDNPFEVAIEFGDGIVRMSGDKFVPFPTDYDGSEEHKAQADEHSRQMYGPYRYEFDLAGHHLLFEAREHDEVIRPNYHARMTCPNGDVWDVFYDSNYGAGLSDCLCGKRDARFDHIDIKAVGENDMQAWPVSRRLPVSCLSKESESGIVKEQAIAVSERSLNRLAESLGIEVAEKVSEDDARRRRRVLYRAMEDESGERFPVSTFSEWRTGHYIDADAVTKLIQFGIELGRLGIDSIECDHWWPRSDKESVSYGLDGTPFEGLTYGLLEKWMVPGEVRYDHGHPLHDDKKSSGDLISEVFDSYLQECEEADWSQVIDVNDLDVELVWPIRDANGKPFSPLMQGDGDTLRWQVARHIGDDEDDCTEVVGCGWNDEVPFILLGDGEMADPKKYEIVDDLGSQDKLEE